MRDKSFTCDTQCAPALCATYLDGTAWRYLEINIPTHSPDYKECAGMFISRYPQAVLEISRSQGGRALCVTSDGFVTHGDPPMGATSL